LRRLRAMHDLGRNQASRRIVHRIAEKGGGDAGAPRRDCRMMETEKMAAGLPPKLTVPMIIVFLPVLLVVVMAPAVMQVMASGF
jgi:hypothetical protein